MSCFSCLGGESSKHDREDATRIALTSGTNQQFVTVEPQKKVIISRPTFEEYYDNSNENIGVALLFNHKYIKGQKARTGTDVDRDNMQRTLQAFGFEVRVYNDLSFAELHETLKKTSSEDHSNNDCFLLVVMSHGTEGKVFAADMNYPVERLWNPFLGESCKTLINKPKFFFIQACRGMNLERPVTFTEFAPMSRELNVMGMQEKPPVITYAIPNTADMMVMYSTFERHYSFRNPENGSWFIQSLCNVLDAAAQGDAATPDGAELLRLLTAVNRKVAYEYQSFTNAEERNQMKEMPNFMSTLTKIFYLKVKATPPGATTANV